MDFSILGLVYTTTNAFDTDMNEEQNEGFHPEN
jgi:hypothetical protein